MPPPPEAQPNTNAANGANRALVLIVLSLSDVGWADVPLLIGGYNLAGVLGIVAFFAPAGLGVKEGVLVGFLASVVSGPVAASLVILARLLFVLADVMLWAVVEAVALVSRLLSGPHPATQAKQQLRAPRGDRQG